MKNLSLALMSLLLVFSTATLSAQGQRGGRGNGGNTSVGNVRGNSSSTSSYKHNDITQGFRPGNQAVNNNNSHSNNNQSYRPGNQVGNNNHNNQGFRPGNQVANNNHNNNGFHPGNQVGNNNHNNQGFRPGNQVANNNHNNNGFRPGNQVVRPVQPNRPVYRPYLPPARPFYRPVPPISWRPVRPVNLWSTILGVTVGMTLNNTLTYLSNSGYSVDGYGSNEVYLRNVDQYGYYWHDATMYYNNGGFVGSRFYYSTLAYNMERYRDVFSYLTSLYGAPVSTSSSSQGTTATWWGSGNQYITLEYAPMLTDSGQRYFTTLSIGI